MNKMAAYELLLEDHPLWSKEAGKMGPHRSVAMTREAISKQLAELRQKFNSKPVPKIEGRMLQLPKLKNKGKALM